MLYDRWHVTFVGVIATLVDSVVVAEFVGYWLHRLLHSDKSPALSRGHWIHHFLIYGPRSTMAKRHDPFNWQGHRTALGPYGLDESELLSLRGCSRALFRKDDGSKTAFRRNLKCHRT